MNREQRRKVGKKLNKKISVDEGRFLDLMMKNKSSVHTKPSDIKDGDKVKINIDAILQRANYDEMTQGYKDFISNNHDTIFTAKVDKCRLISFEENSQWLFWSGDLIKIDDEIAPENETKDAEKT